MDTKITGQNNNSTQKNAKIAQISTKSMNKQRHYSVTKTRPCGHLTTGYKTHRTSQPMQTVAGEGYSVPKSAGGGHSLFQCSFDTESWHSCVAVRGLLVSSFCC